MVPFMLVLVISIVGFGNAILMIDLSDGVENIVSGGTVGSFAYIYEASLGAFDSSQYSA